jgi:peptide/nickel transport system substrate-binding protein
MFGYNPDVKPYNYDPEAAKKLLAEAGYPNGFEITFNFPNGRYLKDKEIGEAIASQWADIGVKTKTASPVWTEFFTMVLNRKQAQTILLGYGNTIWDADFTLTTTLSKPKTEQNPGGSVFSYWVNDKAQSAILEAKSTSDKVKRLALYKEAEQIIHDDAPFVFLHQESNTYAYNKAKISWQGRADEQLNAFEISAAK